MSTRRLIGPITTVAAVGLVGAGWWMVNVSQPPAPPAQVVPAPLAATVAAPPAPAATPEIPAPQGFPMRAEYVADIPLQGHVLTVEIAVDGRYATAYACDNVGIETWLSGKASDSALRLGDKTGADRLTGQLRGGTILGTLWIGERPWGFEAAQSGGGNGY